MLVVHVQRYFDDTVVPPGNQFTWGSNGLGQLGLGDATDRSLPTQLGTLADVWTQLETFTGTGGAPTASTAGIKPDASLWMWGANATGALGQGDTISRSSPTQIGGTWKDVSIGEQHVLGVRTDGTLWVWGTGEQGAFGRGLTVESASSPVQIGAANDWTYATAGQDRSYAIKTNGTLWSWGDNVHGELGHNNVTNRSSPVQVGSATDWIRIESSGFLTGSRFGFAAGLRAGGSLYTWGHNLDTGALGHGDKISRSNPTQVAGTWLDVQTGLQTTMARRSDSTLWTWGLNTGANGVGKLGLNDVIDRSSPTQVGSDTWLTMSLTQHTAMAIKSDGTRWAWGRRLGFVFGDGTSGGNNVSSPVQIGTETDWTRVLCSSSWAFGTRNQA